MLGNQCHLSWQQRPLGVAEVRGGVQLFWHREDVTLGFRHSFFCAFLHGIERDRVGNMPATLFCLCGPLWHKGFERDGVGEACLRPLFGLRKPKLVSPARPEVISNCRKKAITPAFIRGTYVAKGLVDPRLLCHRSMRCCGWAK